MATNPVKGKNNTFVSYIYTHTLLIFQREKHTEIERKRARELESKREQRTMEAFPYKFTRAIRAHWRKRKYQRLEQGRKRTTLVTRLGDGPNRRTRGRFFKLRSIYRIQIRILSPIKILARIRDAYVNAMLSLASKGSAFATQNGPEAYWTKRIPRSGSTRLGSTKYEKRLAAEIYKLLAASGEIVSTLRKREGLELHAS